MKKNLTLSLFAAMTALCLAGCATADTASRPEQPLPLTGTVWIPQFLSNQDKAGLSDDAVVRLVIAADGRCSGAAGDNYFFGHADVTEPDGIRFDRIVLTRRSGPNQQYEQNFVAMLNLARHYSIRGDTLTLCGENKTPLATFRGTVPHNY